MTTTLSYTGELTITSCWCGIRLAIPSDLYTHAYNNGQVVFCPLGHEFVWKETEAQRLAKKLKTAQAAAKFAWASASAARDQRDAANRTAAAYRGHLTRLRNKIANGVCPVPGCKRHFDNIQAHIATVHGAWAEEHPDALVVA